MKIFNTMVCALIIMGSLCGYSYAHDSSADPVAETSLWGVQSRDQEIKDLVRLVKELGIDFIDLNFTDVFGSLKAYTIMSSMFESALKRGVFFDGSSIKGYSDLAHSDLRILPDISTFKVLPWTQAGQMTASMICDIYGIDDKPYDLSPRTMLKKALKKAEEKGFDFYVSPEIEFFIFKRDKDDDSKLLAVDSDGYCAAPTQSAVHTIKLQILKSLDLLGLQPEKTHHEVATDQHEITLRYGNALDIADNVVFAKWVMRFIARNNGYDICFLPKYHAKENGNGMHMNYSLYDLKNKKNAFYAEGGTYNLSDVAQKFIAGNLQHMYAMTALFNPSINSYKRLVPGYEAPVYIAWGSRNRSALIRIPVVVDGDSRSVRAELRSPDPLSNPYLSYAALLRSGLDGIDNDLKLPDPITDNLFLLDRMAISQQGIACLPASLEDALCVMLGNEFMHKTFGTDFVERYVKLKSADVDALKLDVSDSEKKFYSAD